MKPDTDLYKWYNTMENIPYSQAALFEHVKKARTREFALPTTGKHL